MSANTWNIFIIQPVLHAFGCAKGNLSIPCNQFPIVRSSAKVGITSSGARQVRSVWRRKSRYDVRHQLLLGGYL
jgi:hypothetical protein